jgi:LytS/YehU family sensor histidine kinase
LLDHQAMTSTGPNNRSLAIATVAVWVVAYAAWTADWFISPDMGHGFDRALRRILICIVGVGLCWAMVRPLRAAAAWSLPRRLALAAGLCVAGALVEETFSKLVLYVIAPRWGSATFLDLLSGAINSEAWVFLSWAALYFTLDYDARVRDADLALADAQAAVAEARNRALIQQVDPHFLFNALNTVSGLILENRPERANRAVMALSRLLRGSLERELPALRPLAAELAEQGGYIEVQSARFEDRFRFVDEVPPELRDWPVPSLILQPVIENAFTHGVGRTEGLVTLTVHAERDGERLRLSVADDARPISPKPGCGLGLDNVRRRLAALYGDAARLEAGPTQPHGWRTELLLPARAR